MKLTPLSTTSKMLIGLTLYGLSVPLIVWLASVTDYRYGLAGFFLLGFVTFVVALFAATRSNKTISVIIIAALLLAPVSVARADDPPPNDPHTALGVGCVVVIVGGVIIWGLWKICKMIPPLPPPPKNPPPPNGTNQMIGSVSGPSSGAPALLLPDRAIYQTADWQMSVIKFQSSTNLSDWVEEYAVTNWFSGNQLVSLCASNGIPVQTNFIAVAFTNDAVFSDFSSVMPTKETAPFKLWRAVQPQ